MARLHQPGQAVFKSGHRRQALQPSPYVIRVKVPAGVKLMPHRLPGDRIYTVMSGVFYIRLGDRFDGNKVEAHPPGSVIVLPGGTSHFHWAKSGEYVTQVTAIGPLGLEYLDPGDDPRGPPVHDPVSSTHDGLVRDDPRDRRRSATKIYVGGVPMCRFTISSDTPVPNSAELRSRRAFIPALRYRRYWLSAALLLALLPSAARSADEIKIPDDYRNWFHVNTLVVGKENPLFEILGGMHIIHVNADGVAALKKGDPYPEKTIFVDHVHESTLADGAYAEGPLKALTIMVKDSKMYASTGGWGFQAWAGGDPNKPIVTDATKQCFECHQPKKDHDYVYSTYIP
jgi:hypothetical protein